MNYTIKPLFIFSLPRSGSTLLQRILGSHQNIATTSEPWILLPCFYTLNYQGMISEFSHGVMVEAIQDFCGQLPNGRDDYLLEIRSLVLRLYHKASHVNTKYFLDKTPRYHLIVDEIINLFPEAKFIFLWRNPLAIIASMMETWANGKWNIHYYSIDLFDGLSNLIEAYKKYSNQVYSVKYENLLSTPEDELQSLCKYLDLSYNDELLSNFSNTKLQGTHGDPTGIIQYNYINKEPIEKWKKTIKNPIRKAWCQYYLKWIGEERLREIGYNLDELLTEIKGIPFTIDMFHSDLLNISRGTTYNTVKNLLLRHKIHNHI